VVESSSGNLGVALSILVTSKGHPFSCITDSRCNLSARLTMEALGSRVYTVKEPDPIGGFLGARIDYVRSLSASDHRYVWLNQSTNPSNWQGALPVDRAGDRPAIPAVVRSLR